MEMFNKKHAPYLIAAVVMAVTLLVYLPALNNDFVNFDDPNYVTDNKHIRSLGPDFIRWAFTSFHVSNYHPLTWISHAIDYALWGLNPLGHHLTSIVFHGLNTFLAVLLTVMLLNIYRSKKPVNYAPEVSSGSTGMLIAGAVTGLLFGLHPVHVESVAWVSERKDVMSAFFFLLSLLAYLKYATSSERREERRRLYVLSIMLFILALLSKPMAVTLPVVLLLLDVYPLERLKLNSLSIACRNIIIEKIPFIIFSLASSIVTIMAQRKAIASLEIIPSSMRLTVGVQSLYSYLHRMLWPADLAVLYPYPKSVSLITIEYGGAILFVLGVTAFCLWYWKKQKVFLAAWTYYIVTLLPVLGIVQAGSQSSADRYTYLPSIGPFILLGIGIAYIWELFSMDRDKKAAKIFLLTFTLVVIFVLGLNQTTSQIRIWRTSITLWNAELRLFPDSFTAYYNRGKAFEKLGYYSEAVNDLSRVIKLKPRFAMAYYNRGTIYDVYFHDSAQALKDYDKAIELRPDYESAYNNRGSVYATLGNYQKAFEDFSMSLRLNSQDAVTYYNRGTIYDVYFHDSAQALKDYDKAIELRPDYVSAYNNRGSVYATLGNYQKALEDFSMSLRLNSQDPVTYYNRGMLFAIMGRQAQAQGDYQAAARLGNRKAQEYLRLRGISW